MEHVVLSTVGNGSTFREYGVRLNGGTDLLDRAVYPDFAKTSSLQLTTITTIRVD